MTMMLPYHRVNVLTGTKAARLIDDAEEYAFLVKKARRPLFILGPDILTKLVEGRSLAEYAVDIAKALDIPICATAHTQKKLLEMSVVPASSYDIIEIINHLKDQAWKGVKKEGNHDLVMFLGIRSDLCEQGLSTLKHYAVHLKTMTLCPYYFPHASYSLRNFRKGSQWKEFLDDFITKLKKKEA